MRIEKTQWGTVTELLPGAFFTVIVDNVESPIRCYLAGKIRFNKITIGLRDRVEVVVPPGSNIGRIVYRH